MFDLDPSQNCVAGRVTLVTSHQSLDKVMDYKGFESFKGKELHCFSEISYWWFWTNYPFISVSTFRLTWFTQSVVTNSTFLRDTVGNLSGSIFNNYEMSYTWHGRDDIIYISLKSLLNIRYMVLFILMAAP